MIMCQSLPDSARAGCSSDIFHLCKKALRRRIAHSDTVGNVGKHGQVVVAVTKGIGVGQIQMIIIQHVLNARCLGISVRHKFPKGAAPVDAVKPFVADAAECCKLCLLLIPDDEFICKEVRAFEIFWHVMIAARN